MLITIIGNCQAQPLAELLRILAPTIEIVAVHVVHLLKVSEQAAFEDSLVRSDWIFAQHVASNYPVPFVRLESLRSVCENRLLLWPNLFFKGQTPDLCYTTSSSGKRICSPLAEYHSRLVLNAWLAGTSAESTLDKLLSPHSAADDFERIANTSLQELITREETCDTSVSGKIRDDWRDRRLFYTFNHPRCELLLDLAKQLLARASIEVENMISPDYYGEPLSRLVAPTWPGIMQQLRLTYPVSLATRGVQLQFGENAVTFTNRPIYYSPSSFVSTSFQCYDAQRDLFEGYRVT